MDINYLEILAEIKEYGMYAFFYFISYCIFIIPLSIWTIIKFRRKQYFTPRIRINKGFFAFIISCVVVYGIADAYKYAVNEAYGGMGQNYSILIKSVMGMPQESNKKRSNFTLLLDRLNIPIEEWLKPACKLKTKHIEDEVEHTEQYNLLECLSFWGWGGDEEPFCSYKNSEDCASLAADNYLLSRIDLLELIIKISKAPCKFIPTEKEAEILAISKGIDVKESKGDVRSFRKDFECDKASWRRTMQIIILNFRNDKVYPLKIDKKLIIKREE